MKRKKVEHSKLIRELAAHAYDSLPGRRKDHDQLSQRLRTARRSKRAISSDSLVQLVDAAAKEIKNENGKKVNSLDSLREYIRDGFDRSEEWKKCAPEELKKRLQTLCRRPRFRPSPVELALSRFCGWWLEISKAGRRPSFSVGLFFERSESFGYLGTAYDHLGRPRGVWRSTVVALDPSPSAPTIIYRYELWNNGKCEGAGFGEIPLQWQPDRSTLAPRDNASFIDVRDPKGASRPVLDYKSVSMIRLDDALVELGVPYKKPGHWPSIDKSIETLVQRLARGTLTKHRLQKVIC